MDLFCNEAINHSRLYSDSVFCVFVFLVQKVKQPIFSKVPLSSSLVMNNLHLASSCYILRIWSCNCCLLSMTMQEVLHMNHRPNSLFAFPQHPFPHHPVLFTFELSLQSTLPGLGLRGGTDGFCWLIFHADL